MKRILAIFAIAAALCGCDSPAPADDDKYVAFNIVTYEGTSDDGVSTLTYQAIGDSPLLTLTCDWQPRGELAAGTRLLVAYAGLKPVGSGHVSLLQASAVYGGKARWSASADSLGATTEPVWLNSMWRSGHYLNLDCLGRYAPKGRRLELWGDSTAVTPGGYRVLYLRHSGGADDPAVPFDQRVYASWDIDSLWNLPGVEGVTVRLLDANRGVNELTFSKTATAEN